MATFTGPSFFPPLGPAGGSSGSFKPTGWDRCDLADRTIPGITRVTRGGIKLKSDPKKKGGADGANPTFHGIDPQGVEIEVTTFSDEDRETLADILRPILPRAGLVPKPVSIDHPSLRACGISAVQVTGASAMRVIGPMRAVQTIEAVHWMPTTNKPATNTPKGAPVRKVKNVREGSTSPNAVPPTKQPGFGGPPAQLKR